MQTPFKAPNNYRALAWTLLGLLALLVVLEGWRYAIKPSPQRNSRVIAQKLEKAASLFTLQQQQLKAQSHELANLLQAQLEQEHSRTDLLNVMQPYTNLWGIGLFVGSEPVAWQGFSLGVFQELSVTDQEEFYIDVRRQNNVLFWISHVPFEIQRKDQKIPYHLFTVKRIKQTNALPIGDNYQLKMLDALSDEGNYAIKISIFNPLPGPNVPYKVLKTASDDSIGVVYATTTPFQKSIRQWHKSNQFWRFVFALFCFTCVGVFLYYWVDLLPNWKSVLLQLCIIGIGWLIFDYASIARRWLPTLLDHLSAERVQSYQELCQFSITGLFFLLTAFTLHKKLDTQAAVFRSTWFLSSISTAFITGLVNAGAIVTAFWECYDLARSTAFSFLTFQIIPNTGTLLFYLGLGMMLLALTLALITLNRLLLQACKSQYKLVSAVSIASFLVGLFSIQLFVAESFLLNWSFIICLIYFGLIFTISFVSFNSPAIIRRSSPLRNAAIFSFVITVAASTLIYQAQRAGKDEQLLNMVQAYSQQQDTEAKQLTITVLNSLAQEFKELTKEDIQKRIPFIQAQFTQAIEAILEGKEQKYSFDLQFINTNEKRLADYSTDFNSPNWVNRFDLRQLAAAVQIEGITKTNLRPVVQQPNLIDENNYKTFYRGWIPIFGENESEPIAWILCSVYQERPNFDKPMRAVMASLSYQDWNNSFSIQLYEDNQLVEAIHPGIASYYPVYNALQTGKIEALKQDSIIYYTSYTDQNTYRNILVKKEENRVTKVSIILPGYQKILFFFVQLNFVLLIAGFLLVMLYQLIKTGHIAFFGENERFQYRILDSFLLATLLFLIMLIFTTHFALKQQNKGLLRQQLFEKLESITVAISNNPIGNRPSSTDLSLKSLTDPLQVDASFYLDKMVSESTAPQIYQQHLLPQALPFPIFNALFLDLKRDAVTTVKLGNQQLMIGYRSVLSPNRKPVAAVAIPTFIQSPTYSQQLLETTSYLIILYLVVFGLFILGTTFISRQLTRPLHYIQQGLNKISEGDLDTTIHTTEKDEIGSLATAYNQMVGRLKELQDELAAAEREAAWQEMAQQVAHEIKNPLTPMKLNIQHLERQLASNEYDVEELKERVSTITKNLIIQIKSLNDIASDFSKFSRPIEEEFKAVNINKLILSVTDLYQYESGITIQTRLTEHNPVVYGAENELRRVIINLIKNAYEASPKGGVITLQSYRREESVFIDVEDNGKGISEDNKSRIFVPNFSTKSGGTGLGLAICKKVVEAHNGSISFASIVDKGTTFIIKIPLMEPAN